MKIVYFLLTTGGITLSFSLLHIGYIFGTLLTWGVLLYDVWEARTEYKQIKYPTFKLFKKVLANTANINEVDLTGGKKYTLFMDGVYIEFNYQLMYREMINLYLDDQLINLNTDERKILSAPFMDIHREYIIKSEKAYINEQDKLRKQLGDRL